MIKQELKNKAIELRKSGANYNLISKETGITKGMLSYWFSKEKWSIDVLKKNKEINIKESRERILLMNKQRSIQLSEKYRLVEKEAVLEYQKFKNDPLFIAGLMLYLGEGDKSNVNSSTRISNIDYFVLNIFIKFTLKYCNKSISDIHFWVLCYPDLSIEICERWWMEKLSLKKENLYKTQVIQGKHKTKRLLYGVGNIILSGKALKIRILKWINLVCEDLTRV